MRFDEVVQIWRRRAGLTAGLVLLALAGVAAALALFPSTYQSQASVVLLASRAASRLTGGNPYLGFTPSLSLTADVMSRSLTGPETVSQLASEGFGDAYTIAQPAYTTTATGSVLIITVTGTDPAGVERTLHGVIGEIKFALVQMQRNVWPRYRITESTLASSPRASLATSATARPLVMTLLAGLIIALGLPVVIDGGLRRRQVKHAAGRPAGALGQVRLQRRARQLAGSLSRIGSRLRAGAAEAAGAA
jgi:hypothetical protein